MGKAIILRAAEATLLGRASHEMLPTFWPLLLQLSLFRPCSFESPVYIKYYTSRPKTVTPAVELLKMQKICCTFIVYDRSAAATARERETELRRETLYRIHHISAPNDVSLPIFIWPGGD